MHDAEQFADAAFGKTLSIEPHEIFHRQIVERHAARRKMIGAVFPKRHGRAHDLRKVGGEPLA